MLTRREALRTLGASTVLGVVAAGAVHVAVSAAAEPDPTLAAIDTHKAAYDAWMALDDENDPRADDLDCAEKLAWEAVTQVVPTTVYGLSRMSSYVSGHIARDQIDWQSMQAAMQTIAWSAATLQHGKRA